jgi:hypothetical protein
MDRVGRTHSDRSLSAFHSEDEKVKRLVAQIQSFTDRLDPNFRAFYPIPAGADILVSY